MLTITLTFIDEVNKLYNPTTKQVCMYFHYNVARNLKTIIVLNNEKESTEVRNKQHQRKKWQIVKIKWNHRKKQSKKKAKETVKVCLC